MVTLTADEVQRYKRHLVLRDVGAPGQQKLKAARVLVVGAGGLGSPVLMYLAAAGVGTIGIIVESARDAVARINPLVNVETFAERLDSANALDIIGRYNIIADGTDNFATRYLVSDACYLTKRPLAYAALGSFDGYVSLFKPHESDAEGAPYPTLRCLFPEPPPQGLVANCAEAGVLGPVAGVVGTLQAMEVVKEILDLGESLAGRLLIYDALTCRFEIVTVAWDPDNPLSGRAPSITDLSVHQSQGPNSCAAE
jgi:molybdopterin/thiamine biosynthesis adenylyltransferase